MLDKRTASPVTLAERRQIMQQWAHMLDKLTTPAGNKITPIRSKKFAAH